MKRILLALIAALCLAPSIGRCAVVQAVGHDAGHCTPCTTTIAAEGANNTIIVALYGYTTGTTVSSCTDGTHTSSTADYAFSTVGNGPLAVFSFTTGTGGATSISCTQSAAEWSVMMVVEESGLATAPSKDQAIGQEQTGVTTFTSGNVTTTQASEIAFGFFGVGTGTSQVVTPAASWSFLSGTGIDANGQAQETTAGLTLGGMRRVLSSTGTYASGGTGPNDSYGTIIATYKVASGGSCTHAGYTSGGAIATPNGTSGSYLGKTGSFVTPDCSTVQYWSPALGNFTTN